MGYESETGSSKKRALGLSLAVLFHVVLVYALTSGLGRELVKKVQTTVNVAILEQPLPTPPPPPEQVLEEQPEPTKQPEVRRPKAFVPKVENTIKASTTPTEAAITSTALDTSEATPVVREAPSPVAPPAPAAPPPAAVVKSPKLMQGCAQPRYPARSLEKGEEGTVVFRFLIGLDGAVKQAILVQSSGFDRLDEAAKLAFQKCKFSPGMVDGSPRQAWVRQPFRWRLQ